MNERIKERQGWERKETRRIKRREKYENEKKKRRKEN